MLLRLKKFVQRPRPKRQYLPPCLDGIKQVAAVKGLGIIFQQGWSFELHAQCVLRQCSQEALFAENVT